MATTDNERHLRYILLLTEGGTDILHEILKRETRKEMQNSGKLLYDLLKDKKTLLKQWTSKKQQEKLFPTSGIVDTSEWDISLLGTVILQLYGNCLTSDECEYIKQLKTLRNEVAAHPPTLSMDATKYETARKVVASLLIQLSNTLDRSVHNRCQTIIKRVTTGPIDIQTAIERVKVDRNLLEIVQHLSDSVEEIAGKVNILSNNDDKIEVVIQLLQQQQIREQSNAYSFPVLGTKITLKGPDDFITRRIEDLVTAGFEKALKRARGHTDVSKLERAVMSIVEEINQLDDCEVEIDKQCIRMTVQCKSSNGYLQLLEYFRGDAFIQSLLDLVLAAENMYEGLFNITFEIEGNSLDEIIHYIENKRRFHSTTSIEKGDTLYAPYGGVSRENIGLPHDSDPTNMKIENEALLDDILELLDSEYREFPEVILLFGKGGGGKSALINTIHKALTGQYFRIAKHGKGVASTVTMTLNRYENCGITLQSVSDKSRKERMNDTLRKLPHILDCAGLPDVNTWELKELLELLIGGYIPPGTDITHLLEKQEKSGEGTLKIVFDKPKPELKVTKIVFVQGCVDAIPRNLIECLRDTLRIVDEDTFISKYQVDIFVLITKYDRVKDSKDINLRGIHQDEIFNVRELEEVEADLAKLFNYEGAPEFNTLRWVSLTQNVGLDNPFVENIALKFLKQMVAPSVPRVQPFEPVMNMKKRIRLRSLGFRNNVRWCFQQTKLYLMVAAMVAWLAVVFYLINLPATEDSSIQSNVSSDGNLTNATSS